MVGGGGRYSRFCTYPVVEIDIPADKVPSDCDGSSVIAILSGCDDSCVDEVVSCCEDDASDGLLSGCEVEGAGGLLSGCENDGFNDEVLSDGAVLVADLDTMVNRPL